MFVDSSAIVAILSEEPDADVFLETLGSHHFPVTSALVVLETAMRLSTKLSIEPMTMEIMIDRFLREAGIEIISIPAEAAKIAIEASQSMAKVADIRRNRTSPTAFPMPAQRLPVFYKGNDFARTDLA